MSTPHLHGKFVWFERFAVLTDPLGAAVGVIKPAALTAGAR